MQGLLTAPDDVLILYVAAQGVSDEGTPYLLCSDYMRESGGADMKSVPPDAGTKGRMPLDELLGQVQRCRAGTKLVLLDCTHIDADPRLGMVVDEFPRLVAGRSRRSPIGRLWVLACCRPLEVSHVSYSEKRSLFAHFVTDGLQRRGRRQQRSPRRPVEFHAFVSSGRGGAQRRSGPCSSTAAKAWSPSRRPSSCSASPRPPPPNEDGCARTARPGRGGGQR